MLKVLGPILLAIAAVVDAQSVLTADLSQKLHNISPTLFGIFFEEINHAGIGGIDSELIQNRGLEAFSQLIGQVQITPNYPIISLTNQANGPYYVRHCDYQLYFSHLFQSSSITTDPFKIQREGMDSTFQVLPALYNGTFNSDWVSLRSTNYPKKFIRYSGTQLRIDDNTGDQTFALQATFKVVRGLFGANTVSFQTINQGQQYYISLSTNCTGSCSSTVQPCQDVILSANPTKQAASFIVTDPNFSLVYPWTLLTSPSSFFPFPDPNLPGILLDNVSPLSSQNLHSLHITVPTSVTATKVGIANNGFWGINIPAGNSSFNLSFFARIANSSTLRHITAEIQTSDGTTLGRTLVNVVPDGNWSSYASVITVNDVETQSYGRFVIWVASAEAQGADIFFDIVSLKPTDTFKGHGLRKDLMDKVNDLSPAFVRFPGGCYVEGETLSGRFDWKNALGPLQNRPGHQSIWGYWSDDGLGLYEYLVMIEDLKSSPVWVINNGVSHEESIAPNDIQPWVQSALDSLEFAMGPVNTTYGALRSSYGHPAPFQIDIMAIGNEDCGKPYYLENYNIFYKAIKQKYPNITLIANCDLTPNGAPTDLWDYHVYQNPQWFFNNIGVFDSYSRSGPKIFVSEYAVTSGCGQGNLIAAVAEAAFMTGLERNSDLVTLASYAPLFVNVKDRIWNPDAIVFDAGRSFGTPSYHVQKLFSNNKGDFLLQSSVTPSNSQIAASVSFSKNTQQVVFKIVNYNSSPQTLTVQLKSATPTAKNSKVAQLSTITGNDPLDENSFEQPELISIQTSQVSDDGSGTLTLKLSGNSVNVLRVDYESK